jgi:hypothetical protein
MASNLESVEYRAEPMEALKAPGWFRVGAWAATSAAVGGLAVAWYYRKTLARLRQAESLAPAESDINSEGEGI